MPSMARDIMMVANTVPAPSSLKKRYYRVHPNATIAYCHTNLNGTQWGTHKVTDQVPLEFDGGEYVGRDLENDHFIFKRNGGQYWVKAKDLL